ncbi:hypothetical protein NUW58_g6118 [Xylaria curta]|uniref:Uncharacterized protein n=1 Tax=Xylaria curta TaxID=42375 RepID=A0ACC1NZ92_9PEZI|nr:hypothetical protein NUW58_g6118 [Xylaria curta]
MAYNHRPVKISKPPTRPKTAVDYIPTPVCVIAPTETFDHLLNRKQRLAASPVMHPIPLERFVRFGQEPLSPATTSSVKASTKSKGSLLSIAHRTVSLDFLGKGKDKGKTAVKKTKVAMGVASAARYMPRMASKLRGVTNEGPKFPSRSSSSSSTKSLFNRRRLPKLQIPDLNAAVDEALNSVCSAETQHSPNFRLLELSPTSRDLKFEWTRDHHSQDMQAEFHNMLSARRRVRKSKFGCEVIRYCEARPTWGDSWATRALNDNEEDRELLKSLTDALQEQKDAATQLVQRNPDRFPGLEHVSAPGCTLALYWQHKSSYR